MSRHLVFRHSGILVSALFALGCRSDQSALHPAGPAAAEIAWLWWLMCGTFTAVLVLVVSLLFVAIFRNRVLGSSNDSDTAPPLGRTGFVVWGGLVLPIVVVTPLYVLSLQTSASLRTPAEGMTVRVVGHRWWWEIRYPAHGIVTANEIHIPAGVPVRLELTSADVIHSFWVPRLGGKRDLIPGVENVFWIQADQPGVYRGQCAEYCGTQHANMAFQVVALPPAEFAAWLRDRPSSDQPALGEEHAGRQVFMRSGCAQCHAVSGTGAVGNIGPDLTDFGSRQTIGAAMRLNTRENLSRWIRDPLAIKPGIRMPRTDLDGNELEALVSYLEGLQ